MLGSGKQKPHGPQTDRKGTLEDPGHTGKMDSGVEGFKRMKGLSDSQIWGDARELLGVVGLSC